MKLPGRWRSHGLEEEEEEEKKKRKRSTQENRGSLKCVLSQKEERSERQQ